MDETRFDSLTKALVAPRTRRSVLGILGGGALASLGSTALAANDRRDKNVSRRKCIPSGKGCKLKKKKDAHGACQKCCQDVRTVSSTKGVCCQPNGWVCSSNAQCCLGECSVGICQNTTVQLVPPCVAYGGSCTQNGECCDGVPCSGARCQFPSPQPPPDPPPCVPRGQSCTVDTDCCLTLGDAVSCTDGRCITT